MTRLRLYGAVGLCAFAMCCLWVGDRFKDLAVLVEGDPDGPIVTERDKTVLAVVALLGVVWALITLSSHVGRAMGVPL